MRLTWSRLYHWTTSKAFQQGHRHNSDRAAPRPHILCSICFYSFGTSAIAARLFIGSLHNQPMYPKMCSIGISSNLQLVGWNLKGGLFDRRFGVTGTCGRGWANSIAHSWVPISSPLTHMVYLLPVFELVSCSISASARPTRIRFKYRSRSYRFVEWQKIIRKISPQIFQLCFGKYRR